MRISVVLVVHEKYRKYLTTARQSLKPPPHTEIIEQDGTGQRLSVTANQAIQRATGTYIVRLDADDWVEPEILSVEADYLDEHPEIDCVWCDYLNTHASHSGDGYQVFHVEHYPQPKLEHACGAMFRRSVWERLGGYDESLSYQEAFDFWCRFDRAGFKKARIPLPLYYYRRHDGSMSTNPEREQVRKSLEAKYDLHHRRDRQ